MGFCRCLLRCAQVGGGREGGRPKRTRCALFWVERGDGFGAGRVQSGHPKTKQSRVWVVGPGGSANCVYGGEEIDPPRDGAIGSGGVISVPANEPTGDGSAWRPAGRGMIRGGADQYSHGRLKGPTGPWLVGSAKAGASGRVAASGGETGEFAVGMGGATRRAGKRHVGVGHAPQALKADVTLGAAVLVDRHPFYNKGL